MKTPFSIFSFLAIAIFSLTLSTCKKECDCGMTNAEIIGYDYRLCACCGGWELVIENVTPPDNNQFFLIGEMPSSYEIGDNPQFPVLVKIDYSIDTAFCYGNFVKIMRITDR